jgi:predicted transcriptional regulator
MIFAGQKKAELRRICPRVSSGDLALVYVSSPLKELQGAFEVAKVISASPSTLWRKVGKKSKLSRSEFLEYFRGRAVAHALIIKRAWKLPVPLRLTALRKRKGGFRPPQNFHYLNRNESPLLTSLVASQNN